MPKESERRAVIVVKNGEIMDEVELVSKHVRARDELIDHFVNAIRQHKDMMPDEGVRPLDQLLWSALEMSVAEINEIRGLNEWCECEDAHERHLLWTNGVDGICSKCRKLVQLSCYSRRDSIAATREHESIKKKVSGLCICEHKDDSKITLSLDMDGNDIATCDICDKRVKLN